MRHSAKMRILLDSGNPTALGQEYVHYRRLTASLAEILEFRTRKLMR